MTESISRLSKGRLGAVFCVSLSVGFVAAASSIVGAILWSTLPVHDEETLYIVSQRGSSSTSAAVPLPYRAFEHLKDSLPQYTPAGYFRRDANLVTATMSERVEVEVVSANLFDVIGMTSEVGRGFLDSDLADPSSTSVAVISHGVWRRLFDGDERAFGQSVLLNGQPTAIIGVAPEGFGRWSGGATDAWVLARVATTIAPEWELNGPGYSQTFVLARIPSVGGQERLAEVARQVLENVGDRRIRESVDGIEVLPLRQAIADPRVEGISTLVFAGAILLAIIGIVSATNLFAADVRRRRWEVSIRSALGATPGRLARDAIVEALPFAVIAMGLSALFTWSVLRLAILEYPSYFGQLVDANGSWPVVAASVISAFFVIVGLLTPTVSLAFRGARPRVLNNRADEAGGKSVSRVKGLPLAVQTAFTVVVLTYGAVALQSIIGLSLVEWGVDSRNVVTLRFDFD